MDTESYEGNSQRDVRHVASTTLDRDRETAHSRPWRLFGLLGLVFVVVVSVYVGKRANSAQNAVGAPTETTETPRNTGEGRNNNRSNQQGANASMPRRTNGGTIQITKTDSAQGSMTGTWDCMIEVEITPDQGAQVYQMTAPRVHWKDAGLLAIQDEELQQNGDKWTWSGTVLTAPAYAEVVAHFVSSVSEERGVPYQAHKRAAGNGDNASLDEGLDIQAFDPATGKAGKTDDLTIKGENFGNMDQKGPVTIGGHLAGLKSWTDRKIVVTPSKLSTKTAGKKKVVVRDKAANKDEQDWEVKE
jgi:hypothetical protein